MNQDLSTKVGTCIFSNQIRLIIVRLLSFIMYVTIILSIPYRAHMLIGEGLFIWLLRIGVFVIYTFYECVIYQYRYE